MRKGRIWVGALLMLLPALMGAYQLRGALVQREQARIHEQLLSIAQLKVDQIQAWRRERLADAEVLGRNIPVIRGAVRWLAGEEDGESARLLQDYLDVLCREYGYRAAWVIDTRHAMRLGSGHAVDHHVGGERVALDRAWGSGEGILSDIHEDSAADFPHLSVVVPLFHQGRPIGAILLIADVRQMLAPILQAWPPAMATGDAVLVRREGDAIATLGAGSGQPGIAETRRLPLARRELSEVRAMLDPPGLIRGLDERGGRVEAAALPVAGTGWVLMTRMDSAVVAEGVRREVLPMLGWLLAMLVMTAALLGLLWLRHKRRQQRDLRALEAAQQRSLVRFRSLFEQSLDGILLLTPDHRFLDANLAALRLLGYERDELLRLTLPAILAESEHGRLAHEVRVMMEGRPHHREWLHRRKDGSLFVGEVSSRRLDAGSYCATLRDVTERKRFERRENTRALALDLLARAAPLDAILEAIATSVEACDPDLICSILLLDASGRRLYTGAAPTLPAFYSRAIDGLEIGPAAGSCGAAAWLGQRVIAADIGTHPNWAPFRDVAGRAGLGACWSEPIQSASGRILGTFALYRRQPATPTEGDLQLIQQSASLAAIAIDRSRALAALELSEQRYAMANQATSDIIWDWDLETGALWWNDNFHLRFGYSHEAFPPSPEHWRECLHPEDLARVEASRAAAIDGGAAHWSDHYRLRREAGDYAEVEDNCVIRRDAGGRALRLVGAMQDTTERKSAVRQAALASDRYQRVLRAVKDAFWLVDASNGRILEVNEAAVRLSGFSREELLARTVLDLDIDHDQATAMTHIRGMLERGGETFETRHRARDGRVVELEISVIPDAEARVLLSFLRDISERKRAEQEIRALNATLEQRIAERTAELAAKTAELSRISERLQLIMEVSIDGIWDRNLLTGETYYSPGYFAMLGYRPDEWPCHVDTWLNLLHPDDRRAMLQTERERNAAAQFETEFRMRTRDGRYRWIHSRGRVVERDAAGRPVRSVGSHIDITERKLASLSLKQSERRYRELSASLERRVAERTAELAAASEAKSQFLAHMSHELRTPLNAILGFAQILQKDRLTADQRDMIGMIREAGGNLLHLVDDILDLSKIEAGEIMLDRKPFAMSPLLARVDRLLRNLANEKNIAFRVQGPPEHPGQLIGDAHRIEQVLINLTGNAIKFTERGEVGLGVTVVARTEDALRLRFEIRDTGIGIDPVVLDRLFQPFSQGDASITRRFGGTGLGLVISKRLVERMGGELGVSSQVGEGSTFWFELPLPRVPLATPVVDDPAAVPALPLLSPLQGRRVLAVDDSTINLRMIARLLELQGARVSLASDGQAALDTLLARPDDFDLVLMDIQMPVMDGLSATRAIRGNSRLSALPVVALTAGVMPEERQAALDAGVDDFLAKPLDLPRMTEVLSRLLSPASAPKGGMGD